MISVKITSNEAGQRFDKYLKKLLKNAPDSFIYKMLRKKNIVLNGKKADGKEILMIFDEVRFFLADDTLQKFGAEALTSSTKISPIDTDPYYRAYNIFSPIQILYEDANILVANKPSGLLSQKATPDDLSLNEWLIGYLLSTKAITPEVLSTFKPSVCNRLDRNTSGMVACGKSLLGSQYLSHIIKEKTLEKYYYCIVAGVAFLNERITGYLYKDQSKNKVTVFTCEKDVPAVLKPKISYIDTLFRTVKTANNVTLLEVQLYTGKTHQIRAHLAAMGHPIIGDNKYGDSAINKCYIHTGVTSQLLHAHKLIFPPTPISSLACLSNRVLDCGLPDLFTALLKTS